MRKLIRALLIKLLKRFSEKEIKETIFVNKSDINNHLTPKKTKRIVGKKNKNEGLALILPSDRQLRDFSEMMENPFLALSKRRKNPILYESKDGMVKIKVSRHTGHFLASIYDWDIIIFIESKMQEILNSGKDIPPRTMIVPRHELLKALHRHDGKKEENDLKSSLARLKMTGIETTIRNEDGRYDAGFGFLDSWKYTDRKDKKEISITLSQWLYDGICAQGVLLKVSPEYFDLTSAFKRFLYRTARKHAGNKEDSWDFSIEKLYEKSGSESEFKVFKNQLKKAVKAEEGIPDYSVDWIEKGEKILVRFKRSKVGEIDRIVTKFENYQERTDKNNEEIAEEISSTLGGDIKNQRGFE